MIDARPGDLVRLPRDPRHGLVFYRVICPACSWSTLVSRQAGEIAESSGVVQFGRAVRCDRCAEEVRVPATRIEETGRVRSCCRG